MKTTVDYKNFIVRYDTGINKGMRILFNDLSYLIIDIVDYDNGRYYCKLECEGNAIDV